MHTTYQFSSAQEISSDMIESIKSKFKSKSITIIVKENDDELELSDELKTILDERLHENESTYILANESVNRLKKKYGL